MKDVLGTLGSLNKRLSSNLRDAERSLYLRVFDEMESKDEDEGMTEKEYETFLACDAFFIFLKFLPVEHPKSYTIVLSCIKKPAIVVIIVLRVLYEIILFDI